MAIGATVAAYAFLAAYDRIALLHLNKRLGWLFTSATSATTYALSHNIGASALSGSIVRYRAYSTKGLSAGEVGILVAFCSFTFILGIIVLSGLVLVIEPEISERFVDVLPVGASAVTGMLLIGFVVLYVIGSALRFRPLRLGKFELHYPSLPTAIRQVVVGPLEIVCAAAIIYFALPAEGNPGFVIVLGVFLASFSAALLSHAPGGLGILELVFISAMPELEAEDVLAALLVFRLFYLIIPFMFALAIVFLFERNKLREDIERQNNKVLRS